MMKEQHDEEDKKNKFISERHQLKNNNEILSDKNKLLNVSDILFDFFYIK